MSYQSMIKVSFKNTWKDSNIFLYFIETSYANTIKILLASINASENVKNNIQRTFWVWKLLKNGYFD
jgi:hypothetical protein